MSRRLMPDIFKWAVKARVPLIAVSTRDELTASRLVKELTEQDPKTYDWNQKPTKKNQVYLSVGRLGLDGDEEKKAALREAHGIMAGLESSLVLVNHGRFG